MLLLPLLLLPLPLLPTLTSSAVCTGYIQAVNKSHLHWNWKVSIT